MANKKKPVAKKKVTVKKPVAKKKVFKSPKWNVEVPILLVIAIELLIIFIGYIIIDSVLG